MAIAKDASIAARPNAHAASNLALIGVAIALALLNSAATAFWPDAGDNYFTIVAWAMFAFEPIAFGVWTAIGAGSILKRLPLAAGCLMLVFVAPGVVPAAFADLRQHEYTVGIATGFGVFAATTVLFLIFRRFTGFRIIPTTVQTPAENTGLKFSIKELLGLITLYAVVLGLVSQLVFQTKPDPNGLMFLGPDFFIRMFLFGGSIVSAAVLPTLAVPLSILHGRPARRAIAMMPVFWVVATLPVALLVLSADIDDYSEFLGALLLVQLSAVTIGALVAIALRSAGLRLVRSTTKQPKNAILRSPASNP
jgi:hypothetical protein